MKKSGFLLAPRVLYAWGFDSCILHLIWSLHSSLLTSLLYLPCPTIQMGWSTSLQIWFPCVVLLDTTWTFLLFLLPDFWSLERSLECSFSLFYLNYIYRFCLLGFYAVLECLVSINYYYLVFTFSSVSCAQHVVPGASPPFIFSIVFWA